MTGRKTFLGVLLAVMFYPATSMANNWPERPVTLVVPFSPGATADILARRIGLHLSEKLKQPVIVENRPGANGNIGAAFVARARPDGYTLLFGTLGPIVTNKFMYRSSGYDSERAFSPIVALSSSALTLAVSPKIPVRTFPELVAYVKANPGKVNAATSGAGSQAHLTLEALNKLAGISIGHIPYRLVTQALPDLISGELQVAFNYIPTFVPAVQQGTIRGLAVTSRERFKDLPNVPTVEELGFPGFEAIGWNVLVAPAGTPREIVDKINATLNAFLRSDVGKQQLSDMGMTPLGGTPEQLATFIVSERTKWVPIIKNANISL